MLELQPRHEAFCQAYATGLSGAAAARQAGFAHDSAANQAGRLLGRAEIADRIAELRDEAAARRAARADAVIAKIAPVYQACVEAGAFDWVLSAIELEARIAGLVHGAGTIRPRGGFVDGSSAEAEAWERWFEMDRQATEDSERKKAEQKAR